MSLFTISDLHLSLTVDKPMHIFGSRWQDHVEKLEKGWRAVVTDNDTVVVAGDISWAIDLAEAERDLLFLDSLPGKKIIGRGNHDYWWATAAKMKAFFADKGITTIDLLYNNAHTEQGYVICGSRGWYSDEKTAPKESDYDKIVNREVIRLEMSIQEGLRKNDTDELLVFLHFPPVFRGFVCQELIDLLGKYRIGRCFFGHIHGVYDIPHTFFHEGIEFTMTSADFLNFLPMKI